MKKTIPTFLNAVIVVLFLLTACSSNTPTQTQSVAATNDVATPIPSSTKEPTLEIGSTMSGEDGAVLVYVPEGEFTMGSTDGNENERPAHQVFLDAFWIDQTEVTNKQYAACVAAEKCTKPLETTSYTQASYYDNTKFENYPVLNVDWYAANAYCQWAGRRLPTEAEWEKAARGTDGRTYPWGNDKPNKDLVNMISGIITEVGNFEAGKSPYSAYDLAGNAWEWVNDWYDETYYQSSPSSNPLGPNLGTAHVVRSVSYKNVDRDWFGTTAGIPADVIGFRCALPLVPAPVVDLVETTVGDDGAILVKVSAGEFLMGNDNAVGDEKPAHTVYVDTFWIDQTEITNKQYNACVDEGKCNPPSNKDHFSSIEFINHPVVYVSWSNAQSYCEWAGRRLPTEAEWEKAARGTDGRIYPWGNNEPTDNLLNYRGGLGETTEVGKLPAGKSIYDAYDMAGNVLEWVNDWYDYTYYQISPSSNPQGPDSNIIGYRTVKGLSLDEATYFVNSAGRIGFDAQKTFNNIGFRCALTP